MAAGASAVRNSVPTILVTVGVTTMTPERSGSPPPGLSTSRSAAGTPSARSAWHITGSQEIGLARLTWLATQAAVAARTSAAVRGAALAVGLVVGAMACAVLPGRLSRKASDPARARISARATATLKPRPRRAGSGGGAGPGGGAGACGGAGAGDTGLGDTDAGGPNFGGAVAGEGTGAHGGLSPGRRASPFVPWSCGLLRLACPFS